MAVTRAHGSFRDMGIPRVGRRDTRGTLCARIGRSGFPLGTEGAGGLGPMIRAVLR